MTLMLTQLTYEDVYAHQSVSASHTGRSALLVAPTGSGKTEAALFWALGDGDKSGSTPVLCASLSGQHECDV